MTGRWALLLDLTLALLVACWCAARAQDLPPQPDLDLPVSVEGYRPGALAVPVRPSPGGSDPKDEPAPTIYGEEVAAESSSLVYVLDFSGSMDYRRRIDTLKDEFEKSVKGLPAAFQFNVVTYGCWTRVCWADAMRRATEANKAAAIAWVRSQAPQGGTATGPAVALGLQDKTNTAVVLITDGDPNCGAPDAEGHRTMIQSANTQRATINVFGISARGLCRQFCTNVAADSGGSYFDVP